LRELRCPTSLPRPNAQYAQMGGRTFAWSALPLLDPVRIRGAHRGAGRDGLCLLRGRCGVPGLPCLHAWVRTEVRVAGIDLGRARPGAGAGNCASCPFRAWAVDCRTASPPLALGRLPSIPRLHRGRFGSGAREVRRSACRATGRLVLRQPSRRRGRLFPGPPPGSPGVLPGKQLPVPNDRLTSR
jgi:hypothetical protein